MAERVNGMRRAPKRALQLLMKVLEELLLRKEKLFNIHSAVPLCDNWESCRGSSGHPVLPSILYPLANDDFHRGH